uniref:Opsin-5-like n=1 Tax=Sphaeramia orbicularis TaxID=375764 RepID=A0A673BFA3_9TELE
RPGIIFFLSVLGNGLVLAICYRRREKLCGSELLCANLAVVDFFCCVFFYPFPIVSSFNHVWLGENITCVYYGLGCFIFGLCGMFTITAISVIRYLKTCMVYSVWLEDANIRLICAAVWLVSTVWSSFPLFGWGEYVPEPYGLSCTVAWRGYHTSAKDAFYVICSFAFFTLVPVILIVVSQCLILYKVSRFSYLLSARGIRNKLRYTEKRLSMMFFCISLGFIIAWAPYTVVSFLFIFHKDHRYMAPEGFVFPALFAKSSHVYNPFIYFYFNKTFKRELRSLIASFCPKLGGNRVGAHISKSNQAPHPIHIQLQERNRAGSRHKHKNSSKSKELVISNNHGRQVYVCWGSTPKMVASSRGHRPEDKSQSVSL